MPQQDLCIFCKKPINKEMENYVDIYQNERSTPCYAHSECHEKNLESQEKH